MISPAAFRLIILFRLFTKRSESFPSILDCVHIQQRGLLQISIPNFLCMFFKVALQGPFDSPTVCEKNPLFSEHIHSILLASSGRSICTQVLSRIKWLIFCEFHPRRFSPRFMSSWMFMQPVTIRRVLSQVALHHYMTTFTYWHRFLHVLIRAHKMPSQVLHHKE